MQEIEAVLQEAIELKAEFDRIEALPYPAVRRYARRHFRQKLRHFVLSVQTAQKRLSPNEPRQSGQV